MGQRDTVADRGVLSSFAGPQSIQNQVGRQTDTRSETLGEVLKGLSLGRDILLDRNAFSTEGIAQVDIGRYRPRA